MIRNLSLLLPISCSDKRLLLVLARLRVMWQRKREEEEGRRKWFELFELCLSIYFQGGRGRLLYSFLCSVIVATVYILLASLYLARPYKAYLAGLCSSYSAGLYIACIRRGCVARIRRGCVACIQRGCVGRIRRGCIGRIQRGCVGLYLARPYKAVRGRTRLYKIIQGERVTVDKTSTGLTRPTRGPDGVATGSR